MSSSTPSPLVSSTEPLLYFLAGTLLPTLAWIFLRHDGILGGHSKESSTTKAATTTTTTTTTTRTTMTGASQQDDVDDEVDEDLIGVDDTGPSSKWGMMQAPYKMVLCVNPDLSMGKGKIGAQCGHAAVGCYKRASKQCPNAVLAWERTGCAKIAVKCPENQMEEIAVRAMSLDVPLYLVLDSGRTQIAAGSRTVLGLGPAPVHLFEGLTSHLKLL